MKQEIIKLRLFSEKNNFPDDFKLLLKCYVRMRNNNFAELQDLRYLSSFGIKILSFLQIDLNQVDKNYTVDFEKMRIFFGTKN